MDRRSQREQRRRMKDRDTREVFMPVPEPAYDPETDAEVMDSRRRYEKYCCILDGKLPEPAFEELVSQAWPTHDQDGQLQAVDPAFVDVLKGTDSGRVTVGDILVMKHDLYEFGLWLVLSMKAESIRLCCVHEPPMYYNDQWKQFEASDRMNIALKGHPGFASKRALADITLELPTGFITSDLFVRVGWARPFELDEVMSLQGQSREVYCEFSFADMQQEHIQTLAELWKARQASCICRR